jgi:hypothetical protein
MDPYVENKLLCDATPALSENDIASVTRSRGGCGRAFSAGGQRGSRGRGAAAGGRGSNKGRGSKQKRQDAEEFDLDAYVAVRACGDGVLTPMIAQATSP